MDELGNYIDDPKWQDLNLYSPFEAISAVGSVLLANFNNRLIGVNATQLAVALISNLFLFLNMAGRVRFSIAQCIVIVGWYFLYTV